MQKDIISSVNIQTKFITEHSFCLYANHQSENFNKLQRKLNIKIILSGAQNIQISFH